MEYQGGRFPQSNVEGDLGSSGDMSRSRIWRNVAETWIGGGQIELRALAPWSRTHLDFRSADRSAAEKGNDLDGSHLAANLDPCPRSDRHDQSVSLCDQENDSVPPFS